MKQKIVFTNERLWLKINYCTTILLNYIFNSSYNLINDSAKKKKMQFTVYLTNCSN